VSLSDSLPLFLPLFLNGSEATGLDYREVWCLHRGTLLIRITRPLGPPKVPKHRATVGSNGKGVCDEWGTPVALITPPTSRRHLSLKCFGGYRLPLCPPLSL